MPLIVTTLKIINIMLKLPEFCQIFILSIEKANQIWREKCLKGDGMKISYTHILLV